MRMAGLARFAECRGPTANFLGPTLLRALSRARALGAPARTYGSKAPEQELHVAVDPDKSLPVVIETKNVPIYMYAQTMDVEPDAIAQLIKLAESPLPVGFVSAMPDVHLGKGVTIGTVFASTDFICPNAVGVDIGCGMCAVPIKGLHKEDLSHADLVRIQRLIKARIPTGFAKHEAALRGAKDTLDDISHEKPHSEFLRQLMMDAKVANQLGTLGGGNHFVEVLYDEAGQVWAMLHSGSRGIGNTTAQEYDRIAKKQLDAQSIAVPSGLNYLRIDSNEGQDYLQDMEWCQQYAFHNRRFMLDLLIESINDVTSKGPDLADSVNIHHNFCQCERCSYKDPRTGEQIDQEMWVTRKGATSAMPGQKGIIPGSMGTGSFITLGRGNSQSWNSCSHGAGRRMSRTKARENIKQEDFERVMSGIVCDTVSAVRDEAPQAYKDLSVVMANQASLVDIVHRLKPLINVKGIEPGKKWKKK